MPVWPTKADASWIPDFGEAYEVWLPAALPLLQAHRYREAFSAYPWPTFSTVPWARFDTPVSAVRLGVVTTAGIYRPGVDTPFEDSPEGDPRIVELPTDVALDGLDVSHSHIPEEFARADMNVVLPLDHLRALVAERKLGGLASRAFSIVGYRTRAHDVARETAPSLAAALAAAGVDLALIVPV